MSESDLYWDPRIECTAESIRIRRYYPWGTKRIPYEAIRSIERIELRGLKGRWRIWGSGDLRHWANYDPARPRKSVGFFLDVGRAIVPFITPDEPDAAEAVIRARAHLGPG